MTAPTTTWLRRITSPHPSPSRPPGRQAAALLLRLACVALLAWIGYIHLHLWLEGYRQIPTDGPLFLLDAVAAFLLAAILLMWPAPLAGLLAVGYTASTIGALLISLTVAAVLAVAGLTACAVIGYRRRHAPYRPPLPGPDQAPLPEEREMVSLRQAITELHAQLAAARATLDAGHRADAHQHLHIHGLDPAQVAAILAAYRQKAGVVILRNTTNLVPSPPPGVHVARIPSLVLMAFAAAPVAVLLPRSEPPLAAGRLSTIPSITQFGTVHFPTSCNSRVASRFDRAVAQLHSFEFGAAIASFQSVLAGDSTCAMAHWGIALSRWTNPMAVGNRSPAQLRQGRESAEAATRLGARASDSIPARNFIPCGFHPARGNAGGGSARRRGTGRDG